MFISYVLHSSKRSPQASKSQNCYNNATSSKNANVDPSSLKPKLAKYANNVFGQMWSSSSLRHKIVLGHGLGLECEGKARLARYTRTKDKKHDGIHMYGVSGRAAFSRHVTAILNSVLSSHTAPAPATPQSGSGRRTTKTGGQVQCKG